MFKDLWPFIVIQFAIVVMTALLISGTNLLRSSITDYDSQVSEIMDISGLSGEFLNKIDDHLDRESQYSFDDYYKSFDQSIYDLLYRKRYHHVLRLLQNNYLFLDKRDVRCDMLLYYMGYANFELKEYHKAELFWLKLLRRNDKNINVLNSLGVACYEQNKYQDAKNYLEKAFDLNSENILVMKNLLKVYKKLKLVDEAFFLEYRIKEIEQGVLKINNDKIEKKSEYLKSISKSIEIG
ncbi:tetratricopeptide repeat protein [Lentisphaerota bacterium WC36G]|nr:tetratricopeptide repeat protein [Lentisphaerae bacterium WC36]